MLFSEVKVGQKFILASSSSYNEAYIFVKTEKNNEYNAVKESTGTEYEFGPNAKVIVLL